MSDVYVFSDETGNFDFRRAPGASAYFGVGTTTITGPPGALTEAFENLRWDLVGRGQVIDAEFHAAHDRRAIREEVYGVLAGQSMRVDATLLEKCKARPDVRQSIVYFYKLAWFQHFKYVAPQLVTPGDRLVVVAAELNTNKKKKAFKAAVEDVCRQVVPRGVTHEVLFWPAKCVFGLQAADYNLYAIYRKHEAQDWAYYNRIAHTVRSEFRPFDWGSTTYY